MVLQVVIPMAGIGSRFKTYGFKTNKYLLPVNLELQSMIELAITSLKVSVHCEYFFIINEEEGYDEHLREILRTISEKHRLKYRTISVYKLTEGPACTVARAMNQLIMNQPLLVSNSDQILDWNFEKFMKTSANYDGCVLTYRPNYPLVVGSVDKHSFARMNEITGTVEECREKVVLSDKALVGVHYFKEAKMFFDAYEYMKKKNMRAPNGEFYLSLVYQSMNEKHYAVGISEIDPSTETFYPVGEPDDYFHYLYTVGGYQHMVSSLNNNININTVLYTSGNNEVIEYVKVQATHQTIHNDGLILLLKGEGFTDYELQIIEPFQITNDNIITHTSVEFIHIRSSYPMDPFSKKQVWNLCDFTRGWFIGDFLPSILRTQEYEVALLTHPKNEKWDYHYHKEAEEINFLVEGEMTVNNRMIREGEVFRIPRNQLTCPHFLKDCKVLCIKVPSVVGDKYSV
jgi:dTDP-glucose pyrophosphorylase/mannose-6-phosphate isomerase-like protein (cupin superfamily)